MKKTKPLISLILVLCMFLIGTSIVYACDTLTRTPGYWKTHSDEIGPKLPINLGCNLGQNFVSVVDVSQAVSILKKSDSSNGIEKLYAHLLAAKLNLSYGTDDTVIWELIEEIDVFLRDYDTQDWESLSKESIEGQYDQTDVINWLEILDAYNNGLIGPGAAE